MAPGFAIINRIKARDEAVLEKVVEAFKGRAGLVEKRPGFKGLAVLVSRERLEVLVITFWESREAFEAWVESEEFKEAHRRARERRLEGAESEGIEYEVVVESWRLG